MLPYEASVDELDVTNTFLRNWLDPVLSNDSFCTAHKTLNLTLKKVTMHSVLQKTKLGMTVKPLTFSFEIVNAFEIDSIGVARQLVAVIKFRSFGICRVPC